MQCSHAITCKSQVGSDSPGRRLFLRVLGIVTCILIVIGSPPRFRVRIILLYVIIAVGFAIYVGLKHLLRSGCAPCPPPDSDEPEDTSCNAIRLQAASVSSQLAEARKMAPPGPEDPDARALLIEKMEANRQLSQDLYDGFSNIVTQSTADGTDAITYTSDQTTLLTDYCNLKASQASGVSDAAWNYQPADQAPPPTWVTSYEDLKPSCDNFVSLLAEAQTDAEPEAALEAAQAAEADAQTTLDAATAAYSADQENTELIVALKDATLARNEAAAAVKDAEAKASTAQATAETARSNATAAVKAIGESGMEYANGRILMFSQPVASAIEPSPQLTALYEELGALEKAMAEQCTGSVDVPAPSGSATDMGSYPKSIHRVKHTCPPYTFEASDPPPTPPHVPGYSYKKCREAGFDLEFCTVTPMLSLGPGDCKCAGGKFGYINYRKGGACECGGITAVGHY